MRTNNGRTALIAGLVFAIAFGASCADKDNKKGGGGSVTPATSKVMDWSATIKTGQNEYRVIFGKALKPTVDFTKLKTPPKTHELKFVLDGDVAHPLSLEVLQNGDLRVPVDLNNGGRLFGLIYFDGPDPIKDDNGDIMGADFSTWPANSFQVNKKTREIRVLAYNGELSPYPFDWNSTKAGSYEYTISATAKRVPTIQTKGNAKLKGIIDGDIANATEVTVKDGLVTWKGVLADKPDRSLQVGYVDGTTIVEENGKKLVWDLTVWSPWTPNTVDDKNGKLFFGSYKGDITAYGGKSVQGRPYVDGHGLVRFDTWISAGVPAFQMGVFLNPLTAEDENYGVECKWKTALQGLEEIPWYVGWHRVRTAFESYPTNTPQTIQVLVLKKGTQDRSIEFPDNDYLQAGKQSLLEIFASSKGFVAPASVLTDNTSLQGYTVKQSPLVALKVPSAGSGKVVFRVIGTFTNTSVLVDMTLHLDLAWQEITRDAQGNANPVPSGQEKLTITRGERELTTEARSGVNAAVGEVQGTVTFQAPVGGGNAPSPLKKEFSFWVVP